MNNKPKATSMNEDSKTALVPKLRFPEFRDAQGWEEKHLGSACALQAGKFVSASEIHSQNAEGLYPCYGGNGLRGYTATFTHSGKFPLIGRQGALCGNVKLGVGEFHATEHAVVVTPKNGISGDWLFYVLDFLNLNQYATGQAQPGLSVDVLEKLLIGIPYEKEEQQKIADCLSSVDELITAQVRKVDALKTNKKGLMQQLFPRKGEKQPQLRFPEFQDAGEWEEKALGDICEMQAGKFVSASEIKDQNASGLFPCYGGNGLRGYTETYTHEGTYPLIGRQGALCGNIKLAKDKFHATEHAVVATPNQGVEVGWLYYVLNLLNLNRFATGQAQPGLSIDVLEKVPVSIPKTKKEQRRIADCLTYLDDLIAAETQKREALINHKKGLMQQLFPSLEEVGA